METLNLLCSNPKFSSACLKDWNKFGKTNFVTQSKDDVEGCIQNLTDLFIKIICGEGKTDYLTKLIPELEKLFVEDNFASKLADTLWLLDVSLADVADADIKNRFLKILSILKGTVDHSLLLERLSDETLEQVSLISSQSQHRIRYVRIKTRLFYKQQKFNLLREESEGYAKLIVDLSGAPINSAEAVLDHVRSLIGYFDLDPNRVMDVILDVFEVRIKACSLMVQLLKLYNPNKVDLTHILGHKFHFYQNDESSTPQSLHRIAAILVSHDMVDLEILFGHLQPTEAAIHAGRQKCIREAKTWRPNVSLCSNIAQGSLDNMVQPGNVGSNGVATGSLLGDPARPIPNAGGSGSDLDSWNVVTNGVGGRRGLSASMETSNEAEDKVDVWSLDNDADNNGEFQVSNNQKLDLCAALINLGDWNTTKSILDRYPGHWVGAHQPLSKAICQLIHFLIDPLYESNSTLPPSMLRLRHKPQPPEFFLSDEETRRMGVKPTTDFVILARYILPITGYLGPFLSVDVQLIAKLCRICSIYVGEFTSRNSPIDSVYQAIFNMLDEAILPSLNMTSANCCLTEEIWKLVRLLPYDHRYRLYGQWKHMSCQNEPVLLRKRSITLLRTKALMKRLSKENVKPLGRHLCKLSHSNPCVLFDFMLHNIQLFNNLIEPTVDSLKYASGLGYDVLAFCLIEALVAARPKTDATEMGSDLHALAKFTGALCKKYQFDLTGILQYLLNQLKVGRSEDLIVLQEIVNQMAGLDSYEDMTDEQLEAASGGELLLHEGGYYSHIRNARRNANRLKEALIESKVIMPLVFLMAQRRDTILFMDSPDRHVKTAGLLYDQCQSTLVQFITFLSLQLSREEMQVQCFSIEQMMKEYYVPADTAFCLYRSLFLHKVAHVFEASVEKSEGEDKDLGDDKIAYVKAASKVIAEVAQSIEMLYPPRVWEDIDPKFFATFWCLESGDLFFPAGAYHRQRNILRGQLEAIDQNPDLNSDKRRREKERCQNLLNRLARERETRKVHVDRIRAWLLVEREHWFQTVSTTKTDTVNLFLQYCVYPRVFFTAGDAVYAAQFIHVLHQLKTARFATLICLDRIFNDITLPVSICTEKEANRYGRFLCKVLEFVMRWHASEDVFNAECRSYPGFVTIYRKGPRSNTTSDPLEYENYRHVVHKWHYRLTKAIIACLESGNYAQIRNALMVLNRILTYYPKIDQFGNAVERRVNKLKEIEKDRRPDLKVLAFSYAGMLRPLKSTWVAENKFHNAEERTPMSATMAQQNNQPQTSSHNSPSVTDINSSASANATGAAAPGDAAKPSDGVTKTSSTASAGGGRSAKGAATASGQKRFSAASFESTSATAGAEAVSGDDTRESKHRRNMSSKRPRISESQLQQQQQAQQSDDSTGGPVPSSSKDLRRQQRKRAAAAATSSISTVGGGSSDVTEGRASRDSTYVEPEDQVASKRSRKNTVPLRPSATGTQEVEGGGNGEHGSRRRRTPTSAGGHRHHRSAGRRGSGGDSPTPPPQSAQFRHSRK